MRKAADMPDLKKRIARVKRNQAKRASRRYYACDFCGRKMLRTPEAYKAYKENPFCANKGCYDDRVARTNGTNGANVEPQSDVTHVQSGKWNFVVRTRKGGPTFQIWWDAVVSIWPFKERNAWDAVERGRASYFDNDGPATFVCKEQRLMKDLHEASRQLQSYQPKIGAPPLPPRIRGPHLEDVVYEIERRQQQELDGMIEAEGSDWRRRVVSPHEVDGLLGGLRHVINANDVERGSDTPDWILAQLCWDVLQAFRRAVNSRDRWYRDIDGRFKPKW